MNEQVPPPLSNKGSAHAKVAIVIGVLVLGALALLLLLRAPTANRDYARTLICASNLKAIGIAIAGFARDHNGRLPEKLEDVSHYYTSEKMLFCPSAKDQIHYSYVLTGATNVWGVSSNTIIVIEVEPSHYGKRHVLYDDGRVELVASGK
ncbi:MAG TPA: hypothetical protein VMV72_15715 [Verrucomicrobiae bacterium]|nr:hypothetical protein [Verrucomicrobiae bacterium]